MKILIFDVFYFRLKSSRKMKVPQLVDWYDICENYGLVLSPVNTEEKVESYSNLIIEKCNMKDNTNNLWQVGLNFINGKCVWSDGEPYIPEKHDQLFHEDFKPNCQLDRGLVYLKVLEKQLYNVAVDKYINKLCSEPIAANDKSYNLSIIFDILMSVLLLLIFLNIYLFVTSTWYKRLFDFLYPPKFPRTTTEMSNPTTDEVDLNCEEELEDESVETSMTSKLDTES